MRFLPRRKKRTEILFESTSPEEEEEEGNDGMSSYHFHMDPREPCSQGHDDGSQTRDSSHPSSGEYPCARKAACMHRSTSTIERNGPCVLRLFPAKHREVDCLRSIFYIASAAGKEGRRRKEGKKEEIRATKASACGVQSEVEEDMRESILPCSLQPI
jgi:hypothetical protein